VFVVSVLFIVTFISEKEFGIDMGALVALHELSVSL
jgi:hypothetical protein